MLHKEGNIRKMLHEEAFVLHQRKLSNFSERQQGDYMTLRNILYITPCKSIAFTLQ